MTAEELQKLFDPEIRRLIDVHIEEDPSAFALKYHGDVTMPVRAVAEQIACRRKAAKKLPKLVSNDLLYTTLSLEQASGEKTARFKSALDGMAGKRLLDMTGGLGIDSIFLAGRFEEVLYVERDEVLAKVAAHNFRELGIGNIRVISGDSVELLEASADDSFDLIYLDPARREKGKRSVSLEAAQPNVVLLHDLLLQKAGKVCIKASPALEISSLHETLPSLSRVIVISVARECKEIVLICEKDKRQGASRAVVDAVCLYKNAETVISGREGSVEKNTVKLGLGKYFYEPDPAIIKARLTDVLAQKHEMLYINPKVDYLTSDREIVSFPGRRFKVKEFFVYSTKTFRRFLNDARIDAAGIQRRDFPLSPEEIRRKFSLGESDRLFLFFTRNAFLEPVCICCEKLWDTHESRGAAVHGRRPWSGLEFSS